MFQVHTQFKNITLYKLSNSSVTGTNVGLINILKELPGDTPTSDIFFIQNSNQNVSVRTLISIHGYWRQGMYALLIGFKAFIEKLICKDININICKNTFLVQVIHSSALLRVTCFCIKKNLYNIFIVSLYLVKFCCKCSVLILQLMVFNPVISTFHFIMCTTCANRKQMHKMPLSASAQLNVCCFFFKGESWKSFTLLSYGSELIRLPRKDSGVT